MVFRVPTVDVFVVHLAMKLAKEGDFNHKFLFTEF